ncbi:S66 family peptidase [Lacticaseibacillus hegangensis]|uniref:S66 peptidase family protein n=1 Tax=Lacticaseibacillus hegangensis TaxID=2486010 RepID=A0ABW4CXL5_9LACO|nr:S66 peptidase family protein [Lacticaseibacillus hegangensis]
MPFSTNAAGRLKPRSLRRGDQVAIVSLSSGILGEPATAHQLALGKKRLRELGLVPVVMPHALDGLAALAAHPEHRAADLKAAFADPEITGIIAAIGGEDTFRLAPYLMADATFAEAVRQQPKLFTGFSDTTIDHLMLYRLGLQSFYGPNLLNDLAELDTAMLPYTQATFAHYLTNPATTAITASPVWYEEREDFSPAALGTARVSHRETHGLEILRGQGQVRGPLLGGCLESLDDLLVNHLPNERTLSEQYGLMPTPEEWHGKLLFIETSEERPAPASYRLMLQHLKAYGIFDQVVGIIAGKPQNERYYAEYKQILLEETEPEQLPVLFNANFGHAYPRAALPYGGMACLDCTQKAFTITEPFFS